MKVEFIQNKNSWITYSIYRTGEMPPMTQEEFSESVPDNYLPLSSITRTINVVLPLTEHPSFIPFNTPRWHKQLTVRRPRTRQQWIDIGTMIGSEFTSISGSLKAISFYAIQTYKVVQHGDTVDISLSIYYERDDNVR